MSIDYFYCFWFSCYLRFCTWAIQQGFICAVQHFITSFAYQLFWFFPQEIAKRLISIGKPVLFIQDKHRIRNSIKCLLPLFIGSSNLLFCFFAFGDVFKYSNKITLLWAMHGNKQPCVQRFEINLKLLWVSSNSNPAIRFKQLGMSFLNA